MEEQMRTEEDLKEKRKAFRDDLIALCGKYGIENASFCGTIGDEFVSAFCMGELKSVSGVTEAAMNVGRLWQHARSMVKKMLDGFEKGW